MNQAACNPSWISVMSALLTPVIAIAVGYIAWRQWRTAQNRLKLDLFDRRLAIHRAARNLIAAVTSSGKLTNDELHQFLSGIEQTKWLLSDNIARYFEHELWMRAIKLQELCSTLDADGEDRVVNVRKQRELKEWIASQRENLDRKFEPFLKIGHPTLFP